MTLALVASAALSLHAQGTVQDYKNAFGISRKYSYKMANGSVNVRRSYDEGKKDQFIYSVWNGDSTAWYEVNAKTGEKTPQQLELGRWGKPPLDGGARREGRTF